MAVVCVGGEWYLSSCDKLLLAVHTKHNRHSCASEEKGSDKILALAVSLSGKLVALTDDNKRLVLFGTEPSWQCISTRRLVRRCTSLVFTQTEEELLAADKSGDVYSLSVVEPRKAGELKLGHLSMLLAMTLSPNDKYVITADRDEKIRVSYLKSPYNIQSFCLGHREFVSSLLVLPMHPHWLLSGSGDGTMKLWEYESGRRIQSWDLKQLRDTPSTQANEERSAVSKIATSPDGCHVAVQCERVPIVQFFGMDQGVEEHLTPCSRLTLPHSPLDLTFDLQGRLLVLLDSQVTPFQIYMCMQDRWECDSHCLELSRVSEALKPHWKALQTAFGAAESRFQHLYKVNFDNMSSYLEKKQHRLQQQNENWGKKRRAGKGLQIKQARKKAKSEDKGGDEASS
ncbi:tRNA (guanine-N(7)-)-methyltransferase non-catalytic subunit wdr4 isoform X3 [Osmerus mordax]|uniref:tRNA (guanine-N(7)-)-methyltransferase non-catalytic subunit wdr4 isoform X3 n=1 Tax=Osmerus mordax TaxID=8014 RepID=UPI00350EA09A